jgi:hypothetical protein
MPEVMASWLKLTRAPRTPRRDDLADVQRHDHRRGPDRQPYDDPGPDQDTVIGREGGEHHPATKSAAVPSTVGRRPTRSAILPAASAPMRAPISKMLVSSSLSKDVSRESPCR